ncbi:MAG TPA: hypothetical protein VGF32_18045 [Streptosporangiaceae bacterium]|jgi:hypothetical protein
MIGTNDVKNEVRKLASSKPVHAAAGVGVLATQTLRDLPSRIANLHLETTVVALPARANEVVQSARAKAVDEYERLARRGRQALNSGAAQTGQSALNGKNTGRSTASRSSKSK